MVRQVHNVILAKLRCVDDDFVVDGFRGELGRILIRYHEEIKNSVIVLPNHLVVNHGAGRWIHDATINFHEETRFHILIQENKERDGL